MWLSNPTWGAPRIQAELRKLGIDGARFVQMRFTFTNNIGTGQSTTLESLGLAWEE